MARADYTITVTTANAATVTTDPIGAGNPLRGIPGYSEITLSPRFNEAGSGSFTCTASPDLLEAVSAPGVRVAVIRDPGHGGDARVEMAGPIESLPYRYEAARDGSDGPGQVTVRFSDDLASLAERLVYPNPAMTADLQDVAKYTITAVNGEDAMRSLVNLNAGPGALTVRRIPGLVLGTDNGLHPGLPVTTSFTRATVLTDALRFLADLVGVPGFGFRTAQVGTTIEFQVYQGQDLTDSVVFSRALGNVATLEYEPAAPTATAAIVGDATAGVGRVVKERLNSTAISAGWRRREVFVDARSASNATELQQAGDDALAEGGPKTRVAVTAIETPSQRYAYDFGIGDQVSVEPFDGVYVTALVLGADIKVTSDGREVVTPIIGTDGDQVSDPKAAEIRRLWRRIAQLEGAL